MAKTAIAFIVITALIIAMSDNKTVFSLVLLAWGLLAAAFVPLILVYSRKKSPSEPLVITMVFVGIAVDYWFIFLL